MTRYDPECEDCCAEWGSGSFMSRVRNWLLGKLTSVTTSPNITDTSSEVDNRE